MNGPAGTRGWLDFAGYDLQRLALVAGQSPFFAYSREAIADNVARLRAAFPDEISWFYSLKANPWAPVWASRLRMRSRIQTTLGNFKTHPRCDCAKSGSK